MRRIIVALAVMVTAAACSSGSGTLTEQQTNGSSTPTVSIAVVPPAEAAAIIDAAQGRPGFSVLDVRTADEYSGGHIPGAVNLDFYAADFADQIGALDRDAEYVVYCRSGNRSGKTADLMRALGFTNVVDIAGGITAWQSAGLALTTG
jgi:rhodanese-related sulfurtransferase